MDTVARDRTPTKGTVANGLARRGNLKWRTLSLLMKTVGRTSSGIDMGYRYGFDSGVMLDKVYENRASGKYLVGALIDWFYLRAVGWRAIRARRDVLKRVLVRQINDLATLRDGEGMQLTLLDVASGPGRYLLEMCDAMRTSGREVEREINVVCRDLSQNAVQKGDILARSFGLGNFRYETGDAVDFASLATVEPKPNVVVVSGLYELFTDADLIKQSMAGIYQILEPGGRLVFTTQVMHPQLEFIANVLVNRNGEPWIMVCRSTSEVEAFAQEAGFRVLGSEMEPVGLFGITVCEKGRET